MRSHILNYLVAELRASGASTVLDAGCGTGWYTDALVRAGFRCSGVDRSKLKIFLARRLRTAEFTHQDFRSLDGPGFDAVVCVGVLHSVPADERTSYQRALTRLVKPEGSQLPVDIAPDIHRRSDPDSLLIRLDEGAASLLSQGHRRALKAYLDYEGLRGHLEGSEMRVRKHQSLCGGAVQCYACGR